MGVQANGGLSDADMDKMPKDAEAHKVEDEKRKHVVEARNHADATRDSSGKALADHGDKAPGPVKDADDLEAIRAKTQALIEASMKLGEAVYSAREGAANGRNPADHGVVDAEFEEV